MKKSAAILALVGAILLVLHGGCGFGSEPERSPTLEERRKAGGDVALLVAESRHAISLGRFETALAHLDSAAKAAPHLADIPYLRGRAFSEMNQLERSRDALQSARKLDPYYPGISFQLGHVAFRNEQYRQALEWYADELELLRDIREGHVVAPTETEGAAPTVHVQMGRAHARLGEFDAAAASYRRALEVDSTFVPALVDLARLRNEQGEFAQALENGGRALKLAPGDPDIRYVVGLLQLRQGELEEAIGNLEAVAEEQPWRPGAAYNLGRALSLAGREQEAQHYYQHADSMQTLQQHIDQARTEVRQHPYSAKRWRELAFLLHRAGQDKEAERAAATARSVSGED